MGALWLRLTKALETAACGPLRGQVHSVFGHAVNLMVRTPGYGSRLFTVVGPGTPGLPDGMAVTQSDLSALRRSKPGDPASFSAGFGRVTAGAAALLCQNAVRQGSRFAPRAVRPSGELTGISRALARGYEAYAGLGHGKTDGFSRMPPDRAQGAQRSLTGFCLMALKGDGKASARFAGAVIGLGPGLTPSADDAMTGILALLWGASARGYCAQPPEQALGEALLDRTTEVSAKYLRCAREGEFSQPLLNLANAVLDKDAGRLEPLVAQVGDTGGTSGMDLLYGALLACRALEGHLARPDAQEGNGRERA